MALRAGYGPANPEFDAFLLAEIGEDVRGLPLTVKSALARQDRDPETEARRYCGLSHESAMGAMANLIEGLPEGSWTSADARLIASGLLARLPSRASRQGSAAPAVQSNAAAAPWVLRYLIFAAIAAMIAFAIWGMNGQPRDYMDLTSIRSSVFQSPPIGVVSVRVDSFAFSRSRL